MLINYHDTLTTVINATIEKPSEKKKPKNISFLVVFKEDIQNNRTPIHVNVEAEITKGKYQD